MRRGSGDWAGRGLRNWHGSHYFLDGSCCIGPGVNLTRRAGTQACTLHFLVRCVDSRGAVFSATSCSLRSPRIAFGVTHSLFPAHSNRDKCFSGLLLSDHDQTTAYRRTTTGTRAAPWNAAGRRRWKKVHSDVDGSLSGTDGSGD